MTTNPRQQAHRLLTRVLAEHLTLDEAVAREPFTGTDADLRFSLLLTRTVLRHLGQLDEVLANCIDKPLPAKRLAVTNALRLGAAQLLLLDTPAHAAVNESVELIKKGKDAALSGLVNAVLKRVATTKPTLGAPISNLPAWLRARWEKTYGAEVAANIAVIASTQAPLDLSRRDGSSQRLESGHAPIEELPGYHEGLFIVQDRAARMPMRLLGDVKGKRVLDVCAAPGGKSAQLAWAGALVTALDRSEHRMKRLRENMNRLQIDVEIVTADALVWQSREHYDAILLDAPCTASGTWRRHPEVVQLLTQRDIEEMVQLQRQMLRRAWDWLKPGGKLVYCVCSLEPEEGEAQAAWAARVLTDASLVPATADSAIPAACITPEGYLRTRPDMMQEQGGMDGFFAAAFEKR